MERVKFIAGLLLLSVSSAVFAHGGGGMETAVIWFYTLLVIMHGALVLLLHNMMLYKYLWLVVVSLLFSVAAVVLWAMLLPIINNMPNDIGLTIASYLGLIVYFVIVAWAIKTPIKQYRQLLHESNKVLDVEDKDKKQS